MKAPLRRIEGKTCRLWSAWLCLKIPWFPIISLFKHSSLNGHSVTFSSSVLTNPYHLPRLKTHKHNHTPKTMVIPWFYRFLILAARSGRQLPRLLIVGQPFFRGAHPRVVLVGVTSTGWVPKRPGISHTSLSENVGLIFPMIASHFS